MILRFYKITVTSSDKKNTSIYTISVGQSGATGLFDTLQYRYKSSDSWSDFPGYTSPNYSRAFRPSDFENAMFTSHANDYITIRPSITKSMGAETAFWWGGAASGCNSASSTCTIQLHDGPNRVTVASIPGSSPETRGGLGINFGVVNTITIYRPAADAVDPVASAQTTNTNHTPVPAAGTILPPTIVNPITNQSITEPVGQSGISTPSAASTPGVATPATPTPATSSTSSNTSNGTVGSTPDENPIYTGTVSVVQPPVATTSTSPKSPSNTNAVVTTTPGSSSATAKRGSNALPKNGTVASKPVTGTLGASTAPTPTASTNSVIVPISSASAKPKQSSKPRPHPRPTPTKSK